MRPQAILSNALSAVGDTPLIRLNRIPQLEGVKCQVYAKCEFFNAGGSVKDRIATNMLVEAERAGRLVPGHSVVVEPTSGNTGVGLALACAVKGYRCVIVLPEKMSMEKVRTLRALGAEVIRTPTEAAWDDPRSNIMTARRLVEEMNQKERNEGRRDIAVLLDQYSNPANPLAHRVTAQEIIDALQAGTLAERGTAAEIEAERLGGSAARSHLKVPPPPPGAPVAAPTAKAASPLLTPEASPLSSRVASLTLDEAEAGGSRTSAASASTGAASVAPLPPPPTPTSRNVVDVLVAGVGTGGTISGMASRLRERDHNPEVHVLGVDPVGSLLAVPASLNELGQGESAQYQVEGIGYDFDPASLDKAQVSSWVKTRDEEAFRYARALIRDEGLLCGGSSGSCVAGAMRWLRPGGEGWERYGSRADRNVVVILPDSLRNYITKPWLLPDEQ